MAGMSPLHTHDATGLIHVESNAAKNFTLGEFLDVWQGLNINGKTVVATVDGKPVSDFRNILLKDGEKIELDIK
jgi:sulfur carrier protein ThiS